MEWPQEMLTGSWSEAKAKLPLAVKMVAEILGWSAREDRLVTDGVELPCHVDQRRLIVGTSWDLRRSKSNHPKAISVSLLRPVEKCAREIERRTRPHREWSKDAAQRLAKNRAERLAALAVLAQMGVDVPERVAQDQVAAVECTQYIRGLYVRIKVHPGETPTVDIHAEYLPADVARRAMAAIHAGRAARQSPPGGAPEPYCRAQGEEPS